MKLGFVGLGKMGAVMVERLLGRGHEIVAFDLDGEARKSVAEKGADTAASLEELVGKLNPPRLVWLMVPAGRAVENAVSTLAPLLEKGDVLVDGGNSYYRDSMRRAAQLAEKDVSFLDAGTSGGIRGLTEGFCLMVGGDEKAYLAAESVFRDLAPEGGFARVGGSGAGHFVKMVHNGIEYALLQSYAEGFEIMEAARDFELDHARIARLWNRGSVIRSWILDLAAEVFGNNPRLEGIRGYIEDSGEGRWAVAEAIEKNIPARLITLSLLERFRSRQEESFGAKMIAALRHEFGGHAVKKP